MAIAVLLDRAGAERFVVELPARANAVLALTPDARAALKGHAVNVLDPLSCFTDRSQARVVARVRAARRRMLAALAPLQPIEREILIDQFNRVAYGACRLWYTLAQSGPWLVQDGATFREHATRHAAYRATLALMLGPFLIGHRKAAALKAPPLPGVYRALRRLALRPRGHVAATLLIGAFKSQFGLHESFVRESLAVRTVLASPAVAGWKEYLKLGREAMRGVMGQRLIQVALACAPDGRGAGLASRAIEALDDPVIAAALELYREHLGYRLSNAAPARDDAVRLARVLRPSAFVAAEIVGLSNWALAEACGAVGVKRYVMSRNAHAPASGRLARDSSAGYFFARYPEGLVDEYLMWSPNGATAARDVLPRARWSQIRAVRALAPPAVARAHPEAKRQILMADSYASWWYPHSWVFLTSDEYIAAARVLCGVVSRMPNTRLLVRAKNKPECGLAALETLIEPSANCSIKIRDVPFREDLATADLLVAFHSTTIEEALHAHVPVLLWGGTARYSYVPARETPPSRDDRAAVYRVTDASALHPMLSAILDAHAGRLLSDAEVAGHVWPHEVPDIDDFACALASRDTKWPAAVQAAHCDAE